MKVKKQDTNTVGRPKGREFNSRPLDLDPLAANITMVTFYKHLLHFKLTSFVRLFVKINLLLDRYYPVLCRFE
jgi:hypothetical protein